MEELKFLWVCGRFDKMFVLIISKQRSMLLNELTRNVRAQERQYHLSFYSSVFKTIVISFLNPGNFNLRINYIIDKMKSILSSICFAFVFIILSECQNETPPPEH